MIDGAGTIGARAARLLLDDAVDRAALDDAARALGWSLVNVYARRGRRPRQVVYATPEGALIAFVDDHRIAARYLVVHGLEPESALDDARRALAHRTVDDVRATLARDRARGLCLLGVAGPAIASEEWLRAIRSARADEDERVRDAAAFAAEALGWPELGA